MDVVARFFTPPGVEGWDDERHEMQSPRGWTTSGVLSFRRFASGVDIRRNLPRSSRLVLVRRGWQFAAADGLLLLPVSPSAAVGFEQWVWDSAVGRALWHADVWGANLWEPAADLVAG